MFPSRPVHHREPSFTGIMPPLRPPTDHPSILARRDFLRIATTVSAGAGLGLRPTSLFACVAPRGGSAPDVAEFELIVDRSGFRVDDRSANAPMVGGTIPGPLLRLREGQEAVIHVTNRLDEVTSLHWHGLLLPFEQDGVPGFSYDGIAPGETFTYRFPVRQAGSYWYHSHSGTQEQEGMYAPIVIDPAGQDPVAYDREYSILLSDWTDEDPMTVLRNLKGNGAYYNYWKRTLPEFVGGLFDDAGRTIRDRTKWGRMRMDPTDIADVTGATYTYLLNGKSADANWTGLFEPGERVRLRFVNAAAMSFFDVRIPGLKMTVVQADGQDVEPVRVDEFRIGVAETYDVIVEPEAGEAYTIFAQSMDRSGFARGTLAEREGVEGDIPPMDSRPVRSMADMPGMEDHDGHDMTGMDHAAMGHSAESMGLRRLAYEDLAALEPNPDLREPTRDVEVRLTGDMERYFWTLNGKKLSDSDPIRLTVGERVRLLMTNETMMEHPMHIHGVFMELQNGGHPAFAPRKHTVIVPPNQTVEAHLTYEEPGPWAFHCHLLFHMMTGMFARIEVAPAPNAEAS
jgi:CopA family copper-resistance protein